MTINVNKMKALLVMKRDELTRGINDLPQSHVGSPGPADSDDEYTYQDKEDDAVDAQEKALEQSIIASQRALLQEVNDALKRIEDGTYGYCAICGKPISEKRLEAIPWATLGIEEQEALDQRNRREADVTPDNKSGTRFS